MGPYSICTHNKVQYDFANVDDMITVYKYNKYILKIVNINLLILFMPAVSNLPYWSTDSCKHRIFIFCRNLLSLTHLKTSHHKMLLVIQNVIK